MVVVLSEHSIDTWSLYYNQLSIYMKLSSTAQRDFSDELRVSLIYVFRDTHLESCLILCPFSKIIVAGSPQCPMSSPIMVLHQIDNTSHHFLPVEYVIKCSINRLVTHVTLKTLTFMVIYCQYSDYCSS